MLSVRPPNLAPTTWRGFFIQIATISVGLLVALGFEAGGQYLNHRQQLSRTREALRHEHDLNLTLYAVKLDEFHRMTPVLETDLAIFRFLKGHPGAKREEIPGKLRFYNLTIVHVDTAWKNAQQNNSLALMPASELQREADLYHRLQIVTDAAILFRTHLYEARSFSIIDPDPAHLTPSEIDHQIILTRQLLLDHILIGGSIRTLAGRFPEFPAPRQAALTQLLNVAPADDDPELAVLQKRNAEIMASEDATSARK